MAFGFLRDALGLAGAAAGVAGVLGLGRDRSAGRVSALADRQAAIAEALADPNSPMFQQARQQAMEQSRTAQLQAIRDMMGQQARQARRFQAGGGTSFYARNPRRDEMVQRAIMEMGQNEQARADAAARAQLTGSAQALGTATQGAVLAGQARQQQRAAQLAGLAGGLYGAGEILGRLPQFGQPLEAPVQGSVNQPKPTTMFGDIFQRNPFIRFGGQ